MARKAYTSEEISKKMDALPEAAAEFLYSSEMNGVVKGIAEKHSLHIDQMGLLEAETGQLILGLTEPQDFAPYITESLKISAEQAAAIAKEINEQVMSKIRTSMGQPSGIGAPMGMPSAPKPAPAASFAPQPPSSSVMMPSSSRPAVSATSAPVPPPVVVPPSAPASSASAAPAPKPITAAAPAPKLAALPNLGAADAMLSEKKVTPPVTAPISAASAPTAAASVPAAHAPTPTSAAPTASATPKADPTQPQPYKADPYREPVE